MSILSQIFQRKASGGAGLPEAFLAEGGTSHF